MPAVNLSPLFNDAQLDSSGNPASGYKLFTYASGSSTKTAAYTSSAGSVAHTNPVILNSRGEPPSPIFLIDGTNYKFVLTTSGDTDPPASPIRTMDVISGINDIAASSQSEWVSQSVSGLTFTGASTFTCTGDQTTEFHVGRRIKVTDGAGTDYAAISKTSFAVDTTTITIDAATLTTPVSAVALGINSAVNPSDPLASAAIISPGSPLTAFENLAIATTGVATATITADKVVVRNSAGTAAVLSTVSLTVNIASAGANGLDTGAEASSTGYFYWVIWNGTTVAGLLSASSTSPTMPTGYTHKGLVGAVFNNSGSNFNSTAQHGHYVSIATVAVLSLGSATAVTSVSLANAIPPNVWRALLNFVVTGLSATEVDANVYADSAGAITIAIAGNSNSTAPAPKKLSALALLRTSQTLWYAASNVNTDLDINVVGYVW